MNEKINFTKLPVCLTLIFAAISQAAAHEKWFHETENYGLRWDLFFRPLPLIFVFSILLITRRGGKGLCRDRKDAAA